MRKKDNLLMKGLRFFKKRENANRMRRIYFFYEFYIAGYQYYEGHKVEDSLLVGKEVIFKREPNCVYDPKAVEIYKGRKKLGYIPRKDNQVISELLYSGVKIKGKICKRNFDDSSRYKIKISAFKEIKDH